MLKSKDVLTNLNFQRIILATVRIAFVSKGSYESLKNNFMPETRKRLYTSTSLSPLEVPHLISKKRKMW